MKIKYIIVINFLALSIGIFSQETLPIYTDYLTDNIYLIHPTAAGISNDGKIRLTGRKQWLAYTDAPELQTLSFHMPLGNNSAIGTAFYNDKNGYFSQTGGQLTYAYHISLDNHDTHQLSFGLSLLLINNTLDARDFTIQDLDVNPQLYSGNYFNADAGIAYRKEGFFSFYTIKNLLMVERNLFENQYESNNLRRHLITLGYYFNEDQGAVLKLQPSVMGQYIEQTKETFIDANLKAFVPFKNGEFWGGLSYRMSFNDNNLESGNYITPFLGLKYKNLVFSYSYAEQLNDETFTTGSFHQIGLGYNFSINNYKRASWDL